MTAAGPMSSAAARRLHTTEAAALAGLGLLVVHAGPALTAVRGLRRTFLPRLSGVGRATHVALTFDDGPDPTSTPRFLDTLDRHGVRATFFVLGSMLAKAPELGRELVAAGHEIAVHGWSHRCLLARSGRAVRTELARAIGQIEDATGCRPNYFRPPYGLLTTPALVAARRLGLAPVLWTCSGRDWHSWSTSDSVVRTLRSSLDPGATVLLHDSDCASAPDAWRSTLAALPRFLDDCAVRGFAVGPLAEHQQRH